MTRRTKIVPTSDADRPKRRRKKPPTSDADGATAWARACLEGRIPAGALIKAACQRHMTDLAQAERRGLVWDLDASAWTVGFFDRELRLAGGQFEGQPFILDGWQLFFVASLFGWRRIDSGIRRFRVAYLEAAKGNGKSPLLAGVGLFMMTNDQEARAEIYAAAAKKDQAMVLFRDAVAMRDQSPGMKKAVITSGANPVWQLTHLKSGSWFKPLSNDDAKSGPRPSCALVDEVHEHRDRATIDMLEAGFKFRRQPLMALATNSGSDRNSICFEYHEHARQVATGAVEADSFFGMVFGVDDKDDPLNDEGCWPKANPSLGRIIRRDYLAERVASAKALPGKQNDVLRLNFCVWTDAVTAWIERALWIKCEVPFDPLELRGRACYAGLDLSATRDLTALAVIFPMGERRFKGFVEFWTPGDTVAQREERDKAPYSRWIDLGFIHAPEGKVIRTDHVAWRLAEIHEDFELKGLAYDRYGFRNLEPDLDAVGLAIPLIEHPQGFRRRQDSDLWMPGSVKALEEAIVEGRLETLPNPVLTWNVAGARFRSDPQGNRVFSKQKATGRIDGAVALAMAFGAADVGPPPDDTIQKGFVDY